jgi:hypothetical protein
VLIAALPCVSRHEGVGLHTCSPSKAERPHPLKRHYGRYITRLVCPREQGTRVCHFTILPSFYQHMRTLCYEHVPYSNRITPSISSPLHSPCSTVSNAIPALSCTGHAQVQGERVPHCNALKQCTAGPWLASRSATWLRPKAGLKNMILNTLRTRARPRAFPNGGGCFRHGLVRHRHLCTLHTTARSKKTQNTSLPACMLFQ